MLRTGSSISLFSCLFVIFYLRGRIGTQFILLNVLGQLLVFVLGLAVCFFVFFFTCERVSSLRVLGVIVNDQLTATDHVSNILASCNSLL